MSTGDRDVVARMLAAAAELRRRVQTVHERQPCPKCHAPLGQRCRMMPLGWHPGEYPAVSGRLLKRPHRERLRADGIPER